MVCGNFTSSFTPKDALPLVKYIDSDPKLANLTGMIVARDSRNLILVPRIKGHVVNFGDTTRMKEKSHNLFLFYRKVMPHKGWMEYDTVSVKFRDQIVATRRDKKNCSIAKTIWMISIWRSTPSPTSPTSRRKRKLKNEQTGNDRR